MRLRQVRSVMNCAVSFATCCGVGFDIHSGADAGPVQPPGWWQPDNQAPRLPVPQRHTVIPSVTFSTAALLRIMGTITANQPIS